MEKETQIQELNFRIEKLEVKILFHEETQLDIQKEREQMQKKIIDLATMLDKEAEINERRRKELENEINEKVQSKTMENLRKYEEIKAQMIITLEKADEKVHKAEEAEKHLKKEVILTEEKYEREIEAFKRILEASPQKQQEKEEIEKIVGKYEKKITEIIKEKDNEKISINNEYDNAIKEKNELKRKLELAENELRRYIEEKTEYIRKINEKNTNIEEIENKFFSLNQEFKEQLQEMENQFQKDKKGLELMMRSGESCDDVDIFIILIKLYYYSV